MKVSNLATVEMAEVFGNKDRANLAVTVEVDFDLKRIFVVFGDLTKLQVPFDYFKVSGDGTAPDFSEPYVTDHGQTIGFGKYEAAVEAILNDFE